MVLFMEYKCLKCGKTIDAEKECFCPSCGSIMFALPFDTRSKQVDILSKVYHNFLNVSINRDEYIYHSNNYNILVDEKNKLASTIKTHYKLLNYQYVQTTINKAKTFEDFCNRLCSYLSSLEDYYVSEYNIDYDFLFCSVKDNINYVDKNVVDLNKIFHIEFGFNDISYPKVKVLFNEKANSTYISSALDLLHTLKEFVTKIEDYIKRNNIYGLSFISRCPGKYELKENVSYVDEIDEFKNKCVNYKFVSNSIDFFDNDEKIIEDALKVYWQCIDALLKLPIKDKNFSFVIDETTLNENEFIDYVSNMIKKHYENVYLKIEDNKYLDDFTDDEINDMYIGLVDNTGEYFNFSNTDKMLKANQNEKKLNELIGLSSIKESIKKIKAYALKNKDDKNLNLHMCFNGNPGTGKTEVARIIAGILYENGILKNNKVVETDRSGLVGEYVGETAQKTLNIINKSMGGVLFIDEAYALAEQGSFDYGKEAISTLIKAMEDNRGKFCVILAGYKNEMDKLISSNPGFKSRIQFFLDFPNYTRDELNQITRKMIKDRNYNCQDDVVNRILDITEIKRKQNDFSNAREIRNIIDQTIMCQNLRSLDNGSKDILLCDVDKYISDSNMKLPYSSKKALLTGEEELEELVGLNNIKKLVMKINAYAKRNKDADDFNMHMCFYGNPGTGKTEVARILSRILHDSGVLKEAKLIETDASGLIGQYMGETAPKTLNMINDAMSGVLFIDEAYTLKSSGKNDYGDEAISVLLKEMEDRRGRFCVILAGYEDKMKDMIASNPGLESRIQFVLNFPDYNDDELKQIALKFLSKKNYVINDDALNRIIDIAGYYRNKPNFANARTIRRVIEQVIMNQNLRSDDNIVTIDDVEEFINDSNINI